MVGHIFPSQHISELSTYHSHQFWISGFYFKWCFQEIVKYKCVLFPMIDDPLFFFMFVGDCKMVLM